ncbi:MAG: GGDEF domain-containing protein [Pseudomonadota bacterium]
MNPSAQTRSAQLIDHLVQLSGLRKRDDLLRGITQALLESIAAQKVSIFGLVHDENRQFWLPLTEALPGEKVRFVTDPMRGDPDMMESVDSDPQRHQCLNRMEVVVTAPAATGAAFITRFPMTVAEGATLWGVAEVASAQALTPDDWQDATRLVTMYGNILDMLDYSERDALTGLWNRKPFDDLFYKTLKPTEAVAVDQSPDGIEHRATTNTPSNYWLAMVDIDHFKQVNDTYGHLIGDEVLILVARLLKTSFRAYDRVYRFGGEEFLVVLRSADHDAAVAAVERFRTAMAAYEFPQAGHITASVGVTEIVTGDSPAAACERADQAVYYAKHHGRNQVCSEADLVRRGLLKMDLKVGDVELF